VYRYKKIKLSDGSTIDEHRLVWEQHYGPIPEGGIIHHRNGDGRDNRIENLELHSRSSHAAYHMAGVSMEHKKKEPVHGTASCYRRGCHCAECRAYYAHYRAEWRKRTGRH
jgi:hypothetical protein